MKETEKIEIMHFDQEGYLEDGRNVYEAGKRMTALANHVKSCISWVTLPCSPPLPRKHPPRQQKPLPPRAGH